MLGPGWMRIARGRVRSSVREDETSGDGLPGLREAQQTMNPPWIPVAVLGLFDAVMARASGASLKWRDIGILVLFFIGGYALQRFGFRYAGTAIQYVALWICFAVFSVILTYVAAVAGAAAPLRDAEFSALDRMLGFHWTAWDRALGNWPTLQFGLEYVYRSLYLPVLVSTIYFAVTDNSERNRELLILAFVTIIPVAIISGFWPAFGPMGLSIDSSQQLVALRAGTLVRWDRLVGLVAMPSFHTTLAVLAIYANRPPCRSWWPVLVFNVVMLISIPSQGGHYLVDVLAGAALAGVAIWAYRKWGALTAFVPFFQRKREPVPRASAPHAME